MIQSRYASGALAAALFTAMLSGSAVAQKEDDKKISLSLKASPPAGFSPLRVRLSVEIRGGAEDAQELYCPSVEWEWGDNQKSQSSEDCGPYEPGKSTIRRRYNIEHQFNEAGSFSVRFRLKQGNRVVASTSTTVHVREGLREGFDN